jgi:hypothetical protein
MQVDIKFDYLGISIFTHICNKTSNSLGLCGQETSSKQLLHYVHPAGLMRLRSSPVHTPLRLRPLQTSPPCP